jgi:hypothetical protein
MGCCGKKSRGLSADPVRKGEAVRELVIRPRPARPAPMAPPPAAPSQPAAAPKPGGNYTVEDSKVCKVCGTRLQARKIWSDRLRRYYPVSHCSNCSKEA